MSEAVGPEMTAWLRRRIVERRYLAEHAIELGANPEWTEQSSGVLVTGEAGDHQDIWFGTWPMGDSTLTRLMEANDPQDTIARCEAELAILDEHEGRVSEYGGSGFKAGEMACSACGADDGWYGVAWPCQTVLLVAAGYRHRDGYQEAWKPASTLPSPP